MALLCSYACAGYSFDVYDSERVPVGKSSYKYYVTPRRMTLIEQWMYDNFVMKIDKPEQVQELIDKGFIGVYQ